MGSFKNPDNTEIAFPSAFKAGEKLKYRLHYGFIEGGHAYLSLEEKQLNGQKVLHAKALAKTSGLTDKLFKVRDLYECYLDPETCTPIKSIRNVNEGKYKFYNEVEYNVADNKAVSQKTGEHIVPDNIQDIVSSFYYARNSLFKDLKKGQVLTINTFFDDKIYPLKIRFNGHETLKTPFGKIKCLKFSPEVEPGRVFDTKDDLEVWISNDKNFIPVLIRLNLIVGSVKCELIDYEGLLVKLHH